MRRAMERRNDTNYRLSGLTDTLALRKTSWFSNAIASLNRSQLAFIVVSKAEMFWDSE